MMIALGLDIPSQFLDLFQFPSMSFSCHQVGHEKKSFAKIPRILIVGDASKFYITRFNVDVK